jgi:excisionase family DNA binding protein
MEPTLLVADEVAQLLRVDKQRVYELARTEQIPVIRLGARQYRFSAESVKRWLELGGSNSGGETDGRKPFNGKAN